MNGNEKRNLNQTIWVAQWVLACVFAFIGMVKLGLTADQARPLLGLSAGATTRLLHQFGVAEVVIALAVILPGVTGIVPQVSTVAAGGLGAVALLGFFWPATAGCAGMAGANMILVALAAFVVWGRLAQAPINLSSGEDSDAPARESPAALAPLRSEAPSEARSQSGSRARIDLPLHAAPQNSTPT